MDQPGNNQARAVVVRTSASQHAKLRPVPLTGVHLDDEFWAPRRRANREVTLHGQYGHCERTGRIDNFRRAGGKIDGPFHGRFYNDSDVYKWLEAVAWTLACDPDPRLAQMAEAVVGEIEGAQDSDGYLNTYFARDRASERWTNLRDMHELYCAGHLIQAAIALRRATGSERLLRVARRFADHICQTFGTAPEGKRPGVPGHEGIELALVELARETGHAGYLEQAQFFLDARGRGLIGGRAYHQDHRPFRDLERMAGHAVRAAYLCAGAADLCAETGEPALRRVLDRLWRNMTARQIYVSGGIGSRFDGEAFGHDYELPNERAYAETCAAIGNVMWNWRMLALEGDARYADTMETALYNGVLVGLSLDGASYFYQNPLADRGTHRRRPWFDCACCPPNISRLLASLPGHFFSSSDDGIWVHLYAQGRAKVAVPGAGPVHLIQETRYPWEGEITIRVEGSGRFGLWLRIPGWCETGASLEINGRAFRGALVPGTYASIRRAWQTGDRVRLDLPMPVRRVECHPNVANNAGRVALVRGPLLYCVERADNPGIDPRHLQLPEDATFSTECRGGQLGGVVVLRGPAYTVAPGSRWQQHLYRTSGSPGVVPEGQLTEVTAIPYYAWANREPGPMQVWLRTRSGVT